MISSDPRFFPPRSNLGLVIGLVLSFVAYFEISRAFGFFEGNPMSAKQQKIEDAESDEEEVRVWEKEDKS